MTQYQKRNFHPINARLKELAGKNPNRVAVLDARQDRASSRSRHVTCVACGEGEWDVRSKSDICNQCLIDLWSTQSVLKGEYKVGKATGLMPVYMTDIYYWLDHPHLATNYEDVPKDAPFLRDTAGNRSTADSMQQLYVDIFKGLSMALPCDPMSRIDAEPVIPGRNPYDANTMFARLPKIAVFALRDLWSLIRWHSHEAYRQGFAAGHDLLKRMNDGSATHKEFLDDITKETAHRQELMHKVIGREKVRRR